MKVGGKLSYPVETVRWDGKMISRVPEKEYRERLELLCSVGIHDVMLSGYAELEKADFDMDAETRRIGRLLGESGVGCSQHHGLCPSFAPLDGPQQAVVEMLRREVEYTANLHAEVLVIHPGRIAGRFHSAQALADAYEREVRLHSQQAVIDACAENLRAAGSYAAKLGVLIALENVDRFEPLGSPELLPLLVRRTDSPAVGYCLDSGHAHCCGNDPVAWIKTMGDKLFTTHFHDNHGPRDVQPVSGYISAAGIDEHLPPGFGTIDWFGVIAALRETGYRRTVNFESGPWPGEIREGYRSAIRFWRTCENYLNPRGQE